MTVSVEALDARHVRDGELDPALWADLLGVPYRSQGRDKTGLDCLGLVILVHRRMGFDVSDPVASYDARRPGRLFLDHAESGWRRVLDPAPGDAALLRLYGSRLPNHVALLLSTRKILQVHEGSPGVATGSLAPWSDEHRIEGFYRPVAGLLLGRSTTPVTGRSWIRVRVRTNWLDAATERAWLAPIPDGTILDACPSEIYLAAQGESDRIAIVLSGRRLALEEAGRIRFAGGDEVLYAASPGIPVAVVASALAVAETAAVAIAVTAAINIVLGALVAYLASLIATPTPGTPDEGDPASPGYNLEGVRNRAQNGVTIPVCYGTCRVGGQVIQLFTRADAQFRSTLYMLISLGEGRVKSVGGITADSTVGSDAIAGTNILVDGNAASGFRGIKFHVRLGSSDQDLIPGFEETVTGVAVNVILRRSLLFAPVSTCQIIAENDQTYSYSTTTEVDAFEVNIRFPIGLYKVNGDGGTQSFSFCCTLSYERTGDPTSKVTEAVYLGPSMNRADHTRTIRRTMSVRDKYTIYLTRVTQNDDEQSNRFSTSEISSINEILTTAAISYSGQVLLGVEAVGSEQLAGGIPTVAPLVEGKLVWVWDGVSTTSPNLTFEWTDNPAWIALDVLINKRYGLGNYVTLNEIDLQSFKDWADYCDVNITTSGTTHNRWDFNANFDTAQSAWESVQQIAASARAAIVLSGAKFRVKIDQARTPDQLFTMGNIVNGSLRLTYLDTQTRPTFIEVEYRNKNIDYDRDVAQLETGTLAITGVFKKLAVNLFGVTKPEQAYRACKYMLNVSENSDKRLEFEAPIDAVTCEVMDTIYFAHETYSGTYGGRVAADVASATAGIAIDQAVTVPASPAWSIVVRAYDSTTGAETFPAVTPTPGTYAAGAVIPITGPWASTALPKKTDIYAIGPTSTYLKTWRVVRKTLTTQMTVRLECIEYAAANYTDDPGTIETFTDIYPSPRGLPTNPTGLRLTEITARGKDGSIRHTIDVSFSRAMSTYIADAHDVWIREVVETGEDTEAGGGIFAWIYCGMTGTDRFEIGSGIVMRRVYEVSVTPRSRDGVRADPRDGALASIIIVGKIDEPAAPTGLTAMNRGEYTYLTWTPVTDRDVSHYEVRTLYSTSPDAWFFAQKAGCFCGFAGKVIASAELIAPNVNAQGRILMKAVNHSGVPSLMPAGLTVTPSFAPDNLILVTTEPGTWTGTKTQCAVSGTYLRTTASQASSSYVTPDAQFAISSGWLTILLDAYALELTTTVLEAGYTVNSPHANRLWVDGTLLDYPDPEWEYPISSASDFTITSPMAQTIKIDQSQDWETLHVVLIEYDLASDSPPTSWDGYKTYRGPIFVTGRKHVRVRVTFTNAATGRYQTEIRFLAVSTRRANIVQAGSGTQAGTSPRTVTFTHGPFTATPIVFAEPTGENTAYIVRQTNLTVSSVDLQVVDTNQTAISGATFRYVVIAQ